jgi:hypothetical protein
VARSKTRKPPRSEASNKPKTDAMKNLEENLDLLIAFLNRFHPDELHRVINSFGRSVNKLKADPKNIVPSTRVSTKLTTAVNGYLAASRIANEWMSVMLVTFTESYLEDGLIRLAVLNPHLMKDALPIDHNRILEVESIDELREEVRQQWAHQKVEGGPRKFVRRLKDMGARGYDEKEIFRVEHLWDTRNLIVHSRGIVDVAYAKKYKHLQKGVHVKVNLAQLHWWLPAFKGFIECTDQFFLNYRPSPMNKEPV